MAKRKARRSERGRSTGSPMNRPSSTPSNKPWKTAWRWPLALAGIGLIALPVIYFTEDAGSAAQPMVEVTVPQLSESANAGKDPFNDSCAACHGANASGTKKGPPLIHRLYEPSHHPDAAFRRAAKNGVQAHHWGFGNMPRVGISEGELNSIIVYVRELQRANGIH